MSVVKISRGYKTFGKVYKAAAFVSWVSSLSPGQRESAPLC